MEKIVIAVFETPHWEFMVCDKNKSLASLGLFQAWRKHAEQTGADEEYLLKYWDDVYFIEMEIGQAFRDKELFHTYIEGVYNERS